MNYYAAQVKTRGEAKFIKLFKAMHPDIKIPIHFPQRSLDIRRKQKITHTTSAIFPGYIFMELENDENIYKFLPEFRRTEGFYRFLRSNTDIAPLMDRDLELVLHFLRNTDALAGKSLVTFDENSRIVVIEGPLAGLEGNIIKVDKRKGRAKVKLDLCNDFFTIDLAFEAISKNPDNPV